MAEFEVVEEMKAVWGERRRGVRAVVVVGLDAVARGLVVGAGWAGQGGEG